MASSYQSDALFDAADTNRDGRIDKNEFRNLLSKEDGVPTSRYEVSTVGDDLHNQTNRYERYRYKDSITVLSDLATDMPIKSSSVEETRQYLRRFGSSVFVDPNPQIIRRPTTENAVTYEQKVLLRCLQPPLLPPLEPLIVKEVRPEQPPPPPPLVIREHGVCASQPPPLILRERPPIPPARIAGETVIHQLPPVPLPPRSLIIERFPDCPPKPRDIIIERWLPYSAVTERRKIIQHAPPAIKYPAPTHTVIIYDTHQSRVVQKIERLGTTQEDPEAYIARYGTTLLDRDTLVQHARNAGIIEDISCLLMTSAADVIAQGYSSSGVYSYGGIQRISGTELVTTDNARYSSSLQHSHGYDAVTTVATEIQPTDHVDDNVVTNTTPTIAE